MKKVTLISLLLGLLLAVVIGNRTAVYLDVTPPRVDTASGQSVKITGGLCSGVFIDVENAVFAYRAGIPLRWQKNDPPVRLDSCGIGIVPATCKSFLYSDPVCAPMENVKTETKNSITVMYLRSWQFYANWAIGSTAVEALIFGIIKLRQKRVNGRHA